MMLEQLRKDLLSVYFAALGAVNGRHSVQQQLKKSGLQGPIYAIAIGKAAVAMMQGAIDTFSGNLVKGLLITKTGYSDAGHFSQTIHTIEAGHPWPTESSLKAGNALLEFIHSAPQDAQLLFLISGGTSSLVEVLPDGVSLQELHRVNDWLLGSGLDIHAMNHVRKAISCIKGGRLALQLAGRSALALLISDVPGDEPATIGSGLLVPDILQQTEAPLELPGWIEALMQKGVPAPQHDDPCFDSIRIEIVACLDDAKRAAAEKARVLGYEVYEHAAMLGGDAVLVGRHLASELLAGPKGLYIWGGETTVRLPQLPGRGGRNQQLALSVAIELEGEPQLALLAAGTDGSDGPTHDAGALVDGGTIKRGRDESLNPKDTLEKADAGSFLAASGDLIQTGPTGTNVMDLMLAIKA